MPISHPAPQHNARDRRPDRRPDRRAGFYAARLAAVRAQISFLHAAPYAYGLNGPHRRQRDEDILLSIAADINARLIEARAT
jgi:hypothetical protein